MEILLNILKEAQDRHGYLSEETLKEISEKHNIPLARLYGVASFYTMLKLEPQGEHRIELCSSPSCVLNKGKEVEDAITEELGIKAGHTTSDNKFSYYKTSCIGFCNEAPAMLLDHKPETNLSREKIKCIIAMLRGGENADTAQDKP
jgi:NADH-quinone oxidoreductase subunit E